VVRSTYLISNKILSQLNDEICVVPNTDITKHIRFPVTKRQKKNNLRNVNNRGKQHARKSLFLFGNEAHTASLVLCPSAPTPACLKPHLDISVSP